MRAVYLLAIPFLLLSVFFTQWYLCDVRGLCGRTATFEILVMLVGGLVVGFGTSWILSENAFQIVRSRLGGLQREKNGLREQVDILEKENQSARKHLAEWQMEVSNLLKRKQASEPLALEAQNKLAALERELEQYRRQYSNLKTESDEIRQMASTLKRQLELEREKIQLLSSSDEKEKKNIVDNQISPRSRFTPSTWQTKNDLTLISGIGPAIQRKLNAIGIFSFQQISELTPEMIENIARAIQFFPNRIGRDNWIGQAAALNRQKK